MLTRATPDVGLGAGRWRRRRKIIHSTQPPSGGRDGPDADRQAPRAAGAGARFHSDTWPGLAEARRRPKAARQQDAGLAETVDRAWLCRAHRAARLWRLRRRARRVGSGGDRRGVQPRQPVSGPDQPGHQHAGANAARSRHRGTAASMDWPDHPRRGDLVPGLLRTRFRQRSCRGQYARRAGRRGLRGQRPEGLDQLGALRRHDVPAVPHRARPAEARGPVVSVAVDADTGHRGAAAEDDDRAQRVQRGVLHRRARPGAADRAGPRQGLARRQHNPEARAADDRRRRQDDASAGTACCAAAIDHRERPAADRHARVPRPAAEAARRGSGVEGAQPPFADRGGEGRGIRGEADDREIRRHHAGVPPVRAGGGCARRRRTGVRIARRDSRGRRRHHVEHRLHLRCRPDDRRRIEQHPEEHHR